MSQILARSGRRYIAQHPWQIGLSILGVALGVAVTLAIDIANQSASEAFRSSTNSVAGAATHQIVGPVGVPNEAFETVRVELGVRPSAPIVEADIELGDGSERTFTLLGIDPLVEGPFRPYLAGIGGGGGDAVQAMMMQPGAVLVSEDLAAADPSFAIGQTIPVEVGARRSSVTVIGTLAPRDDVTRTALRGMFITDIASAQEILGEPDRLTRIDLILPDTDAGRARAETLRAQLPPGLQLVRAERRGEAVVQMTRAFDLNLTALSLLAMVVGMFLIYNAMTFSVLQRRRLIGTLRVLGVTRGQVLGMILREAWWIGLLGTILGVALGVVLAQGLVQLVTRTIGELYFTINVTAFTLTPLMIAKSIGLGIGATLLASMPAAREATKARPQTALARSSVESGLRRSLPRITMVAAGLTVLGAGLLLIPTTSLIVSYGGLFSVLVGSSLFVPITVVGLMRLLRPILGRLGGMHGRMAATGVTASLSRTAVAIAALTIAVGTSIGVTVMIASFRGNVQDWLGNTLQADVYLSSPSLVARKQTATLPEPFATDARSLPGVVAYNANRHLELTRADGSLVNLVAMDIADRGHDSYTFRQTVAGGPDAAWDRFENSPDGATCFVSEPYAFFHEVEIGDAVSLPTDRGEQDFEVVGIYVNYVSDQGYVALDRSTFNSFYEDRRISTISLYLAEGASEEAVRAALREMIPADQQVNIQSNRDLRTASMAVFDRTFAVTDVLQLLAATIAFIGVLSALMALQLERRREIGMLRAIGFTPRQVFASTVAQSGLMGLAAGLLAIPVGLTLATVLIHVINKRSFGWTLEMALTPAALVEAVVLAILAAGLASLYPARKMAQTPPSEAIRAE